MVVTVIKYVKLLLTNTNIEQQLEASQKLFKFHIPLKIEIIKEKATNLPLKQSDRMIPEFRGTSTF